MSCITQSLKQSLTRASLPRAQLYHAQPRSTLQSIHRPFSTANQFNMPEKLKAEEVNSKTDPSVAKQYDTETDSHTKFEELYKIIDGLKIGLLTTQRSNIGPVSRSMAVAKRVGPDFLFLSNKHSKKFTDISENPTAQITFQDSSTQNWVSITGKVTTADNSDPRIKEVYSKAVSAWFGDLGDGVHNGTPEDPRMSLIEVKASYIGYWKTESTKLGYLKEVAQASLTGTVAQTGVTREMNEAEIQKARSMA